MDDVLEGDDLQVIPVTRLANGHHPYVPESSQSEAVTQYSKSSGPSLNPTQADRSVEELRYSVCSDTGSSVANGKSEARNHSYTTTEGTAYDDYRSYLLPPDDNLDRRQDMGTARRCHSVENIGQAEYETKRSGYHDGQSMLERVQTLPMYDDGTQSAGSHVQDPPHTVVPSHRQSGYGKRGPLAASLDTVYDASYKPHHFDRSSTSFKEVNNTEKNTGYIKISTW